MTDCAALEILAVRGDPAVAEVALGRLRSADRLRVEIVDGLAYPVPRRDKWIINLSTQFGCPVGCPFCDAGGGFAGNPTAEELLAQVRWALGRHPRTAARCRKLKVHFARMGEPALNDAVLEAIERLPAVVRSPGLWCCLATVAPRGRQIWFEQLLSLAQGLFPGRFQLQFSVQSTDETTRQRLIPIPHWKLAEIAAFGERFHRPGERRVALNFALAAGVPFAPQTLISQFDPAHFAIKLTPLNPTARAAGAGWRTVLRAPGAAWLLDHREALTAAGFEVIVSIGDPAENAIGSNCGQLARVWRPPAQAMAAEPSALRPKPGAASTGSRRAGAARTRACSREIRARTRPAGCVS